MINGDSGADVNARYPEWSATDTVPYRVSSFAPSRAAGSLRGYRCPSSRPAGFAGRRGGGILLLLLYFLLLHLLGFRWTRNRPQGWRSRCERGHANKGGGEKLVKDRVHLAWEDPLDKNRESRSSMSDPIRRYVVTVSGYLKRHSVRRRKILRNITDSFVRLSFLLERTTSFWNGASMVRGFDTSSSCYL